MQEQLMIIVNEQDEQIGLMPKMQTHELGIKFLIHPKSVADENTK